jgi:hypothetical protein
MKPGPITALFLAAVLSLPLAAAPAISAVPGRTESAAAFALKRIADRYALTKVRIAALLDTRMNPVPLPANLPNPFYRPTDLAAPDGNRGGPGVVPGGTGTSPDLPTEPDASDAGTLAKFISTLKVSGVTVMKGVSHLTLNQTLCKAGDIIPVDVKGRTVYVQVKAITPDQLTLRLNEEEQVVRLRM